MTLSGVQKERLLEITEGGAKFDEPLSAYSAIKIGGPAYAVVSPRDVGMLKDIILWSTGEGLSYMSLGNGSNTLIRDGGFKGLVINFRKTFSEIQTVGETGEDLSLSVGAGLNTATLVQFAAENGFSGVEGLAGIPGTIGGNIITNAGTFLGCIADVVDEITVVDRSVKEFSIKRKGLQFSYRSLKMPRSTAVVGALLKLKKGDPGTIKNLIEESLERRKKTQPWGALTLGSIFKNPSGAKSNEEGGRKAGSLIEEAGLKGVRVGDARISDKHANFIVNEGGASARDIEILIALIKERVKEKFGVVLETEIKIVGEI